MGSASPRSLLGVVLRPRQPYNQFEDKLYDASPQLAPPSHTQHVWHLFELFKQDQIHALSSSTYSEVKAGFVTYQSWH